VFVGLYRLFSRVLRLRLLGPRSGRSSPVIDTRLPTSQHSAPLYWARIRERQYPAIYNISHDGSVMYRRDEPLERETQMSVPCAFSHLRGIACRIRKVRARSVSPARRALGQRQPSQRFSTNVSIPRHLPIEREISLQPWLRTGLWPPAQRARRSPRATSPYGRGTASTAPRPLTVGFP
jgi:hypothetical protein